MILLIVLFFSFILFIESFPLYRNKQWKELCTHSVILVAALVLAILLSLGVQVPSPAKPLKKLVDLIVDTKQ